ncbi:MAG: PH domain-containing protein [Dysgonamonadaceae bacterium]|jgi:hypothetical protein|nr:PH domain-containing protein [Dysgonamonadaceae bacterium]
MTCHCSWDTSVILITSAFVIILLAAGVSLFVKSTYCRKEGAKRNALFCLLGTLFCVGVLIVCALDCPLRISVNNESVTIHKGKGNVVIHIESMEEIRQYEGSVRIAAGYSVQAALSVTWENLTTPSWATVKCM